jgi:hypothetical protein
MTGQGHSWSSWWYVGGYTADSGPGTFIQTGGVVSNQYGINLGGNSTNHVGRYEISGGTLASAEQALNIADKNVAAFRLIGSAPDVTVKYLNASGGKSFLLEYVLTKAAPHLSPIKFTMQGQKKCGNLRVGLDGGVLLTQTNAFTLIETTNYLTSAGDYLSKPDTNMWTEAFAGGSGHPTYGMSRITLSNGYKQGDLDMAGMKTADFAARAMGHVTIANVNTNAFEQGLAVWLDVDAVTYGNTVSNLVDGLVAAGYTNSTVTTESPYNVIVVVPKGNVTDGSYYFLWDFTDVTTGATNATVSRVLLTTWPPPPRGTMIAIR